MTFVNYAQRRHRPDETACLGGRLLKTLSQVGWATYWFGALASRYPGGNAQLRELRRRKLVRCIGTVERCDGDGFGESNADGTQRIATGWTLTARGVEACDDWRDKIKAEGRGPR